MAYSVWLAGRRAGRGSDAPPNQRDGSHIEAHQLIKRREFGRRLGPSVGGHYWPLCVLQIHLAHSCRSGPNESSGNRSRPSNKNKHARLSLGSLAAAVVVGCELIVDRPASQSFVCASSCARLSSSSSSSALIVATVAFFSSATAGH